VFDTLVNVVEPEAIRIWRTRLWKRWSDSSSTRRKHWAVLSFVTYDQTAWTTMWCRRYTIVYWGFTQSPPCPTSTTHSTSRSQL